ncbi:MAG TPA: helical backbone metal receptor [Cytophagaceae bacterium]
MVKCVKDQLDREVYVNVPAQKIISLVPSQTELLFDLGLEKEVIGVTKFCDEPRELTKTRIKVGGTKNVNLSKILSLRPDLILANKEENLKEDMEKLAEEVPVWVSDVSDLDSAWNMIEQVGRLTGKKKMARTLTDMIRHSFSNLYFRRELKVVYFIWKAPYMVAGGDTFINFMLKKCGFVNLFASFMRYPTVTFEEIRQLNPDLILLSSEPYPFRENHLPEFQQLCPSANVLLVDGKMFSWYGSRLKYAADYFRRLRGAID